MSLSLAIVWDQNPELLSLGSFSLRYYSLLFAGGILMGYMLVKRIMLKEGYHPDKIEKMVFYIILATIIGARLGHCLFYEPAYYLRHPLEMILPFNFEGGKFNFTGYLGLASHGGILAVFLSMILFSRQEKINFFSIADKVAVGGMLAGACIRLGNFMNSEIIGKATNSDYGIIFKRVDDVVRHPAQLYEAGAYFIIFLILFFLYKKTSLNTRMPGFIFGLFFSLLFLSRFIIENYKIIQVDFEEGMLLNMGQLLSIPFFVGGLLVMLWSYNKSKTESAA